MEKLIANRGEKGEERGGFSLTFSPFNTIQYDTIQYNTIQYTTIQHNTIQYNTI